METNKQKAALLVMDMQSPMVSMVPGGKTFTGNVAKAIANAREKKIPVIYVIVGFRQGMPEVSPDNKGFASRKESMAKINMEEWMRIDSSVAPLADEIIVTKRRVSAFAGSDLEVVLRSQDIQHMVLTGISTSGVVLSTTREAADKDYLLTILSDGCADPDTEVHSVLMSKVFPRQADVITVEEWCKL